MLVFVYGTLKNPKVYSAVCKKNLADLPDFKPAVLKDYTKRSLNIIPVEGEEVIGFVLDAPDEDIVHLDYYEGIEQDYYWKIDVEPILEDGSKIKCMAYQMVGEYTTE